MPIASTLLYVKGLLNDLPMPGGIPNMVAWVLPPDPNELAGAQPTAYVWPTEGDESRDPAKGGTIPRNTGPGTDSGTKPEEHMIDVWIDYFGPDDDPQGDSQFPGIVDAVMAVLRTSANPVTVTDPWTAEQSTLIDVGENMHYHIVVNAVADQVFDRFQSLLRCQVLELIRA